MIRYLITGTGRCGTQWITAALRVLGYRVGHESVFTPQTLAENTWRARLDHQRCGCSWLAMARLDEIPADVAVIQLVREPLAVIRSLVGIKFFDQPGPYADIAREATGIEGGGIEAAARFWLVANLRIRERANLIVRVEQPFTTLRSVVSLIDGGRKVPDAPIEAAVRAAPPNMNSRDRAAVDRPDISEPLRNDIEALAREFGYEA